MRLQLQGNPSIQRILIIKWSALGDVIISTAILEDLRKAFPDAVIDLNTMPQWEKLFRHDSRVNNLLVVDLRGQEKGWGGISKWLTAVRQGDYDLVIDLQTNDRTRLLLSLLRIMSPGRPILMGNAKHFPYQLSPPWRKRPLDISALDQHRRMLQAGGIEAGTPRPVLHIPLENRKRAVQILAANGLTEQRFAVFIPGCQAAGHLKRWGTENYVGLANLLHDAEIEKIALVGSKDEMQDCQDIAAACGSWVSNLCGQTDIFDLVPIFEQARLIVGNDTGPTHLASCTDRPIVVICGPTDPRRVKPAGDNVQAIQADMPCINCYKKECEHHTCMRAITPQMVFEKLQAAITG